VKNRFTMAKPENLMPSGVGPKLPDLCPSFTLFPVGLNWSCQKLRLSQARFATSLGIAAHRSAVES